MTTQTFWDKTHPLYADYNRLWSELVPSDGGCETLEGELLRASTRLYWDYYNNGFINNTSGAWNFVQQNVQGEDVQAALKVIRPYVNTGDYAPNSLGTEIKAALQVVVAHTVQMVLDKNGAYTYGQYDMFTLQEESIFPDDNDEDELDDDWDDVDDWGESEDEYNLRPKNQ